MLRCVSRRSGPVLEQFLQRASRNFVSRMRLPDIDAHDVENGDTIEAGEPDAVA